MHHDRRRMFHAHLHWDLPTGEDPYERDRFDTQEAVYLVASDASRQQHLASVRLLPSTSPHLLKAKYSFLCETEVPIGRATWEMGRICTSYALSAQDATYTRSLLATGLIEFALLHRIELLTSIIRVGRLPQLLCAGWRCAPLGPPRSVDGEMVGAISIQVSPEMLRNFRTSLGLFGSVLRFEDMPEAA